MHLLQVIPPGRFRVAPCAGAWVEILVKPGYQLVQKGSLPVRERGLKYPAQGFGLQAQRRSLCGSVG